MWQIAYSLSSWGAVIFLVSLAATRLSFTNRFLQYANEAVLPFYLFHQTVILVVGWYVLQWGMGVLAELVVILLISFPLTVLLYEVLVRRIGFMRFLFGMTPRK